LKRKAKVRVRVKSVVKVEPDKQIVDAELEIHGAPESPIDIPEQVLEVEVPVKPEHTFIDWLKSVFH
jgi:hypothetical protein